MLERLVLMLLPIAAATVAMVALGDQTQLPMQAVAVALDLIPQAREALEEEALALFTMPQEMRLQTTVLLVAAVVVLLVVLVERAAQGIKA